MKIRIKKRPAVSAVVSAEIENLRKLRKQGDYDSMGQIFWKAFVSLPNGPTRDAYSKEWKRMSKSEQAACES